MGIKVRDVAYVRFSAPDLDEMEAFLTEFGMVRAERSGDALYVRGLDGDPFLHVTHQGEPRFLAAGFKAASMRDLEALAREEKASIDPLDGPGGGSVVRLTDPDGFRIEVVSRTAIRCANRRACAGTHQRRLCDAAGKRAQTPCEGTFACEAARPLRAEREQFPRLGSVVQIAPRADYFR